MRWKVYYSDGTTYCDMDGPIEDAPKRGVIIVASECDLMGRKYDRSTDYYCWFDYGWRGVDIFGMYDYLTQPGYKVVLFGRTVEDSVWRELWDIATRDDYLPRKSATSATETEKGLTHD